MPLATLKLIDFLRIKETGCYTVNSKLASYDIIAKKEKLPKNITETDAEYPRIPTRYLVAIFGFLSFAILNAQRINVVMALVSMTNTTTQYATSSSSECPKVSSRNITDELVGGTKLFNWNPDMESYIISFSFVGYVLTQLVGGRLSEHLGAKQMLSFSLLCASICTLISPMAATWSIYYLITVQFLKGMAQGIIIPAVSCLMAKWYPEDELSFLSSVTWSGFPAGALAGGIGSGALCGSNILGGWPSSFYMFGTMGVMLALSVPLVLYNSPEEYCAKKKQIDQKITENDRIKEEPKTPWHKILSSIPTWALLCGMFGQYWMTFYFISVHPKYLANVLSFNISENGLISSLPYILQAIVTWTSSYVGDWFIRREYASTNTIRKTCNSLSCLLFSLSMLGVSIAGCSITFNIVCFFIAMSSIGLGYPGSLTTPMDMTKHYAGTLMGLSSTIGSASGFIIPVMQGNITYEQQTLSQWNKVMYISIAVVMISGLIFHVFGTAKLQNWEVVLQPSSEKAKDKNAEMNNGKNLEIYRIYIRRRSSASDIASFSEKV